MNIVEDNPIMAKEVFDLMLDKKYISGFVPVEDWKSRLCAKAARGGDYILNVLIQSLENMPSHLHNDSRFDCSRFESALSRYNVGRPSVDIDYFNKALLPSPVSLEGPSER